MHSHDHRHHHHHHGSAASWVVRIALVATLGLVATEFVVGSMSHSLALVSDGWHNLTDVPSLILSWIALYFERRPPDERKTFGYQRAGVLVAFVNALLLVGVGIYLTYEAYTRVMRPEAVASGSMLVVGVVALVVNGGISWGLFREQSDLNMRAVFIHNLGDAISNVAIIVGAWIIGRFGSAYTMIDPILGFLIAALVVLSAIGIIRDSVEILMESLPKGMTLENVATAMLKVQGIVEVHDMHIWCLGSNSQALSCHVHILDMPTSETEQIAHQVREILAHEFDIHHTTIQFEHTHPPGEFHMYMPAVKSSDK